MANGKENLIGTEISGSRYPRSLDRCILGFLVVAACGIIIGVSVGLAMSKRAAVNMSSGDDSARIAATLLSQVPLIDGHNDLPWQFRQYAQNKVYSVDMATDLRNVWTEDVKMTENFTRLPPQTDIPRLQAGMVGAQFWAAFALCKSSGKDAVRQGFDQVDVIHKYTRRYPDIFEMAYTADDIERIFQKGKIASLIGLEGGHMIGNTLGVLRNFCRAGVRYMTLTHSCDIDWATNYKVDEKNSSSVGLTDFGKIVVKEMNRLGVMIDLSHVSKQTMLDALDTSVAPVIFSHSSVFSICPHYRNVQDDVLQKTKQNNGLVMINFYNHYINCGDNMSPNTTLKNATDHIDYVKKLIGVDHVGIGADYDGVDLLPIGLEDVSKYPDLFAELHRNYGWTEDELKKLAGGNLLRVMREVEQVKQHQANVEPYEDIIPEEDIVDKNCTTSF